MTLQRELRVMDRKIEELAYTNKPLLALGISPLVCFSLTDFHLCIFNACYLGSLYYISRYVDAERLKMFSIRCQDHFGPEGEILACLIPLFSICAASILYTSPRMFTVLPTISLASMISCHFIRFSVYPKWLVKLIEMWKNRHDFWVTMKIISGAIFTIGSFISFGFFMKWIFECMKQSLLSMWNRRPNY